MPSKRKRRREVFRLPTMANISTSIGRPLKLKSATDRTVKELPGAVRMESAAGFAIAAAISEESRDGISNGAALCDRPWIFYETKTSPSLKQRAERC